MNTPLMRAYRGRLAPSPTGYLHLGHARTFWVAWQRARAAAGKLVFRNEDLDYQRCRPEFVGAMYEDLRWLGLDWDEGPDVGGPFAPYSQSERRGFYLEAWRRLRDGGFIYPCTCSRKDLELALSAPHEALHGAELPGADDELSYPGTCREKLGTARGYDSPAGVSWRFQVPDGEPISFDDGFFGPQQFVAGRDFADFLLWRRDDIPAYQLAVVVDDEAMQITEVVRGADLLKSTARQLLLIRALGYSTPAYFHCPLLRDEKNVRLAKRHDALSLRALRGQGATPESLMQQFEQDLRLTNRPSSP
jgi:glutamyl-tRNA synthetase